MLIRSSEHKDGAGWTWALVLSYEASYFGEEFLVLMSSAFPPREPMAVQILLQIKDQAASFLECDFSIEYTNFNSFLPLSVWYPVLHCIWDPPVTFCIAISRKYIFNLPGCEMREPSYNYEKRRCDLGELDCFKIRLLSLHLYTDISSNF